MFLTVCSVKAKCRWTNRISASSCFFHTTAHSPLPVFFKQLRIALFLKVYVHLNVKLFMANVHDL